MCACVCWEEGGGVSWLKHTQTDKHTHSFTEKHMKRQKNKHRQPRTKTQADMETHKMQRQVNTNKSNSVYTHRHNERDRRTDGRRLHCAALSTETPPSFSSLLTPAHLKPSPENIVVHVVGFYLPNYSGSARLSGQIHKNRELHLKKK